MAKKRPVNAAPGDSGYQAALQDFIIDESTPDSKVFNPIIDGEVAAHGLVPRDYSLYPEEMFAPPTEIEPIPRSEWSDRIKEMKRTKSRISDILLAQNIPSTWQNGDGYCWVYSTVTCVMTIRAINGQPYKFLNPHAVGAIIKRGRNEGGWCGLSAKFLSEYGVPSEEFWPRLSRDLKHDTPAMRANAALHKVTEEWRDLARPVHGQRMTEDQIMTCLLNRIPVAIDLNWWRHSVMACDPVEVEPGSFGKRIRNSHGEQYGDRGFAVLRGSRAIADGAVAIAVAGASPN